MSRLKTERKCTKAKRLPTIETTIVQEIAITLLKDVLVTLNNFL